MSLRELDHFYLNHDEPLRGCFLALRELISDFDPEITEEWKWRLPFFYYRKRMCCFLWMDKKTSKPYINFAEGYRMQHPALVQGDRKRFRILPIDPDEDLPVNVITELLEESKELLGSKP